MENIRSENFQDQPLDVNYENSEETKKETKQLSPKKESNDT